MCGTRLGTGSGLSITLLKGHFRKLVVIAISFHTLVIASSAFTI
jgi:hypothetical protein